MKSLQQAEKKSDEHLRQHSMDKEMYQESLFYLKEYGQQKHYGNANVNF